MHENEGQELPNTRLWSRRAAVAAAVGTGAGAVAACGGGNTPAKPPTSTGQMVGVTQSATAKGTLIGDGSTSDTGPQPHQQKFPRLKAGDTPPQLIVVSWDGAAEIRSMGLLTRFRKVAADTNASMTLFLSGIYTLPESKRMLYRPPHHAVGASDINFLDEEDLHATIKGIGEAWLEGHEVGTHFNGHFCGSNGVGAWSPQDWASEIDQAKYFVKHWKTTTGFTDLPPLPFDYDKELIGSRTPCLQGSKNLRVTASQLGWRYDSSATGIQMWPGKVRNLWDVSLQSIPFPGHKFDVLSMDYNMMFNQSRTTRGPAAKYPTWRAQARDSYLAGFERAYESNRAPLIIGNHFEGWNGGIYMDAVEDFMRTVAKHDDVHLISFRQLCDYLDAQDPALLAKLRTLPYGTKPPGGWANFLQPATATATSSTSSTGSTATVN